MNKKLKSLLALLPMAALLAGCNPPKANLKTEDQKISYGIGLDIGNRVTQQGVKLDAEAVAAGVHDAVAKAPPQVPVAELRQLMAARQHAITEERRQAQAAAAEKSKAESDAFLAANKDKEGVKTTASGLQYKVVKEGTGKKAASTSKVTVQYVGSLVDGTVFGDTSKQSQPAVLPVNGVIPGWSEGLAMMREGSVYEFYIPANLAYGEQGRPANAVPGNAALIFHVELVKVD